MRGSHRRGTQSLLWGALVHVCLTSKELPELLRRRSGQPCAKSCREQVQGITRSPHLALASSADGMSAVADANCEARDDCHTLVDPPLGPGAQATGCDNPLRALKTLD